MSRQHPWPHVTGNRIPILILVSEILDHCQNLLDDPRKFLFQTATNQRLDNEKVRGLLLTRLVYHCKK